MTILLLKPYATYASGATIDLDNATEAALVAQGLATYTTNPGAAFNPVSPAIQQELNDSYPMVVNNSSGHPQIRTSNGRWSLGYTQAAWPQRIPTLSTTASSMVSTASGATTDATGYAIGLGTVTLASAGTGSLVVGTSITFAGDATIYVITAGDADVSGGGTISFLPVLAANIPAAPTAITVRMSAAGAATQISSAITFAPSDSGAFLLLGGPWLSAGSSYRTVGTWASLNENGHGCANFILDTADSTGRFEVILYGSSAVAQNGCRVLIRQQDGSYQKLSNGPTFSTPAADGLTYRGLVTLGAAGRYVIMLEFSVRAAWFGVSVGPTDRISAVAKPTRRYLMLGDSYQFTISDSNAFFNGGDTFPNLLRYQTGYDYWVSGVGGSGYTIDGQGTKPSAHLASTLGQCPTNLDGINFCFSYNDATNSVAVASVMAEVALCRGIAKSLRPNAELIWSTGWIVDAMTTTSLAYFLAYAVALKAYAAANGDRFINLLQLGTQIDVDGTWNAVTSTAITGGASTTVVVGSAPAPYATGLVNAGRTGWYVTVLDGVNTETRLVTTMGTTDPRTLTTSAWTFSHAIGTPVIITGAAWITGTGRQGATTGSGTADRYVGTDGVHPTAPGHVAIADNMTAAWAATLAP